MVQLVTRPPKNNLKISYLGVDLRERFDQYVEHHGLMKSWEEGLFDSGPERAQRRYNECFDKFIGMVGSHKNEEQRAGYLKWALDKSCGIKRCGTLFASSVKSGLAAS